MLINGEEQKRSKKYLKVTIKTTLISTGKFENYIRLGVGKL